jgi:hypothetical protein
MSGIIMLERVVAVLCLGHIVVNVIMAVEGIRMAALLGKKWETTVDFTTIAAFLMSVSVMAHWILATK